MNPLASTLRRIAPAVAAAALLSSTTFQHAALAADKQVATNLKPQQEEYFPLQSYRVGPYAAGGTGFFGGFIDYMNLVNIRDGGVNGVKLWWNECETEYEVERGVECYEREKTQGNPGPAAFNPLSVGIAYALIDRATADKFPLITINHGRTDTTDGAVFPYVFPLLLNPWSEASAMVNYVGQRDGSLANLKGKQIVVLYHGSPYGKETIPIFDLLSKKYGFTVTEIEVPHPGNEQESQWLQIERIHPEWVFLRGWGVMNPVALKTATFGVIPKKTCGPRARPRSATSRSPIIPRARISPSCKRSSSAFTAPGRVIYKIRAVSAAAITRSASSTAS
jgi:branched-chain amino acid transport system substrate-binding protein